VGEESSSERNDTWGLVRVSRACRDHVFDVPLVFVFSVPNSFYSTRSTIE